VPLWRSQPVTVIARTNTTLLLVALDALGYVHADKHGDHNNEDGRSKQSSHVPLDKNIKNSEPTSSVDPDLMVPGNEEHRIGQSGLPKIHINGEGEQSGLSLWYQTLQLIRDIYAIYDAGPTGVQLNVNKFPEFASFGGWITWWEFCQECDDRELQKYSNGVLVVRKLRRHTLDAMELFRREVMDSRYTAEESHIILSTCHSAKGMEWDYVQVCNDFLDMCCFKCTKKMTSNLNLAQMSSSSPSPSSLHWQFDFSPYDDKLNLAYVACTRAKQVLSIPSPMMELLRFFDSVQVWHSMLQQQQQQQQRQHPFSSQQQPQQQAQPRMQTVGFQIPRRKEPLSEVEAIAFYNQLVLPLRQEFGLNDDVTLCDYLLDTVSCPSPKGDHYNDNNTNAAVHATVNVVSSQEENDSMMHSAEELEDEDLVTDVLQSTVSVFDHDENDEQANDVNGKATRNDVPVNGIINIKFNEGIDEEILAYAGIKTLKRPLSPSSLSGLPILKRSMNTTQPHMGMYL